MARVRPQRHKILAYALRGFERLVTEQLSSNSQVSDVFGRWPLKCRPGNRLF